MYLEKIDKLVNEQKYQQALILIEEGLADNINSIEFYQRKANVLYFLGRYLESLKASEACINLGGKSAWNYARKGLTLFQIGRNSEALKFLENACNKGLENTEVYFCYAMCLKEFDIEKSVIFFRKAVELNADVIFRDWNIKMISVNSILNNRLKSWIYNKDIRYAKISSLLNKNNAKNYAEKKKIKVPQTYLITNNFDNLQLDSFPDRVVIKPEDGYSSRGCFVVENGVDLFTLKKIPNQLNEFLVHNVQCFCSKNSDKVIFEELIEDVDCVNDPYLKIPRDFKVYVANGQVFWIYVYNRNTKPPFRNIATYDSKWNRLKRFDKYYLEGVSENKPKFFENLIEVAKSISREFPYVMRLDFYISVKGVIFGEFTPNPGNGNDFTEFGERCMQQLFFIYPDVFFE